ncbi:hypothetical protein L9F63_006474, partial [Diploptera punctata]
NVVSKTLELFVESLLTKAMEITSAKNAKTLSPSHMKQCILSESRFDFLKDLVKSLPDVTTCDSEDSSVQPNACSLPSNSTGNPDSAMTGFRRSQEDCNISSSMEDGDYVPNIAEPAPLITNRMNPNFYKENLEGAAAMNVGHQALPPPSQSSVLYSNVPETRDIEDSDGDNEEFKSSALTAQYIPPPQVSGIIDEDYDT